MKDVIAGNMIRYRKSLRLSQERLAEMAGVTRQSINNYEKGKTLPDSKTLSDLAYVLGVGLDDLLRAEGDDQLQFRFRARESFGKSPQFAAQVCKLLATYTQLEQAVGLHPYAPESTPCDKVQGNEEYIQEIASQFRHRIGLGDAPISNLFEAVEGVGLKVLRLPVLAEGFFGLGACSSDSGAFVLINSNVTIERQIFTLAHEIGHLIFHRGEYQDTLKDEGTKDEEKFREGVANYFAGHLLVCQPEFERVYRFTKDILKLKVHFRVSYQTILRRLSDMKQIDYQKEIIKIKGIYKNRNGVSLKNSEELEPSLNLKEFPKNVRFNNLVWQALEAEEITETTAAELLDIKLQDLGKERIKRHSQDSDFYVIK
ncbi:MAG: ImmA/IrrE family metallo-endopeptidase [Pseudanabaena sp.]|jgi:Zn-dependent peptidase ImmA (M78 family)/DNA-binding XRE family transcriptional regulator